MKRPREVFFSFAESDRPQAEALVSCLRAHGVHVWFAPHDVAGATHWQAEIGDALKRCDWFMVLVTPHSVQRMWVRREVTYALNRQDLERRITPIVHDGCDPEQLSWVLTLIQAEPTGVDLCARLLANWGVTFEPASTAPLDPTPP